MKYATYLRFVFNSDFFKNSRFRKVKSPADFVANTVRLSGRHTDGYEHGLAKLPRATDCHGAGVAEPAHRGGLAHRS